MKCYGVYNEHFFFIGKKSKKPIQDLESIDLYKIVFRACVFNIFAIV